MGLTAQSLVKRFGAITAVDTITLSVDKGTVLGFLGPNGAGKSTTMKMLTGFLRPTSGTAAICGHDVQEAPEAAKRHLGYLPEGAPAYADMTPRQMLQFTGRARGLDGLDRAIARAAAALSLEKVMDRPMETLSKGFRRRVGLAQAILHDPDVLILDEPTDGLDPNQKHEVRRLIASMAETKAIIVSTHILEEVEAVCSRAIVIDRGRLVFDGTPAELRAKDRPASALTVTVAADQMAAARTALETLPSVATVRPRPVDGRLAELELDGADTVILMHEVAGLIRERGWQGARLSTAPASLDRVFRTLTTGDTGRETRT